MRTIGPIGAPPANEHMAFFQAYFDESGKHQSQRVVSFCGLLNSLSSWGAFEDEWRYLLRHNKKPALHISKEDLKATAAQIKLYRPFIHVIKKYVKCGIGCTVDVKAFGMAHKSVTTGYRGDPHYLAFYTSVRDVVKYVRVLENPSVALICDDEPSKACDTYKMFDVMRQNAKQPENRQTLKSIAFADSKFYCQLQAADLFAWIGRAESLFRFFGEEYSLRELYREIQMPSTESRIDWRTSFWDSAHLRELSQNMTRGLSTK